MPRYATPDAVLWSRVEKQSNGCWNHPGSPRQPYASVCWRGIDTTAHRLAWTLTYGPIPAGLCVLHDCDNKRCCNPSHLFLGTHQDNSSHAVLHGRYPMGDAHHARLHPEKLARGDRHPSRTHPERMPRGDKHKNTKISDADVKVIRRRYRDGETSPQIALDYPCHYKSIWAIATYRTRQSVSD